MTEKCNKSKYADLPFCLFVRHKKGNFGDLHGTVWTSKNEAQNDSLSFDVDAGFFLFLGDCWDCSLH